MERGALVSPIWSGEIPGVSGKAGGVRLEVVKGHLLPVSPKTAWIFLETTLSDGTCGFGEATAFGAERAVLSEIAVLADAVARCRPSPFGPALELLEGRELSAARRAVIAALEQALFDGVARRAGLPLATLLGGPYRSSIPVYANLNRGIDDRSPEGSARQARSVVSEEGYSAVKIAPFDGYRWDRTGGRAGRQLIEAGLARVFAVRDALGSDVDILVDCHGRLDPAGADMVLNELAAAAIFWIEDPLDAAVFDSASQRMVRQAAHRCGTRVAGGEALETLRAANDLISAGGHDVILPDLRLIGIRKGLAVLELATASGVSASLHNPVGPVLDAFSRHVAAALPDFLILERQVRETPLYDELRGSAVALHRGAADLETSGGNGFSIDRDVMTKAACRPFTPAPSLAGIAGAGLDA